jgi:hypothetical protein
MKPILYSLIVITIVIILSVSLQLELFAQGSNPLSQLYKNTLCGISINYLSGWVKEESNKKIDVKGSSTTTLATIEPNTKDGFMSTVELEANSMSNYLDKSIQGIGDFMKEYIQMGPDTTIEQSGTAEVNGYPSYKIVYIQSFSSTTGSPQVWKIMEVYVLSDNIEYTLRFTATDSEHYYKHISTVENMIQSIKIEGQKCY